jgi:hypothetical protein
MVMVVVMRMPIGPVRMGMTMRVRMVMRVSVSRVIVGHM